MLPPPWKNFPSPRKESVNVLGKSFKISDYYYMWTKKSSTVLDLPVQFVVNARNVTIDTKHIVEINTIPDLMQ